MPKPSAELLLLGCAVLVGVVQLLWATIAARFQQGLEYGRGPQDEPSPLSGGAARLQRSYRNFLETFPLHAAAVVVVYLLAKTGPVTLWGSGLYVIGRALHPAMYYLSIPWTRTLVWFIAFTGTLMVVSAIFL
ncbi:MAG: hypothetical protein CFE28_11105 [Alphaproteobacteria bacterium PA2]|nr:MAG: hypothetical protein CFE28_11105 [Alphaproteobacteria bacterium PA2]